MDIRELDQNDCELRNRKLLDPEQKWITIRMYTEGNKSFDGHSSSGFFFDYWKNSLETEQEIEDLRTCLNTLLDRFIQQKKNPTKYKKIEEDENGNSIWKKE